MKIVIDSRIKMPVMVFSNRVGFPLRELIGKDVGVSERYKSAAADDFVKFNNNEYWASLFMRALSECSIPVPEGILELGCGGGNLTFPMLEATSAKVYATDISLNQLEILGKNASSQGLEDRVVLLKVDARRNYFKPESFEMVVGSAILHHLVDPQNLVRDTLRTLKPGGWAIFFEPILSGHLVLREALIAALASSSEIPSNVSEFLRGIIHDIEVRSDALTTFTHRQRLSLDDKSFVDLDRLRAENQNALVRVLPILSHDAGKIVTTHVKNILRSYAGFEDFESIKGDFWSVLGRYDREFGTSSESPVIEGILVIQKEPV